MASAVAAARCCAIFMLSSLSCRRQRFSAVGGGGNALVTNLSGFIHRDCDSGTAYVCPCSPSRDTVRYVAFRAHLWTAMAVLSFLDAASPSPVLWPLNACLLNRHEYCGSVSALCGTLSLIWGRSYSCLWNYKDVTRLSYGSDAISSRGLGGPRERTEILRGVAAK